MITPYSYQPLSYGDEDGEEKWDKVVSYIKAIKDKLAEEEPDDMSSL